MTPNIACKSFTQIGLQIARWRTKWRPCKGMTVSQAFIFHFKCYSILHFAVCQLVCQLLCWAFLFVFHTVGERRYNYLLHGHFSSAHRSTDFDDQVALYKALSNTVITDLLLTGIRPISVLNYYHKYHKFHNTTG